MVSKDKFVEAWKAHPAKKLEKFIYAKFSKKTKVSMIVNFALVVPFVMGFIGTVLKLPHGFVGFVTVTYTFELLTLGVPWIIAWYQRRHRVKKVAEDLGISFVDCAIALDLYEKYLDADD